MVKNSIKVYARLRNEHSRKSKSNYHVSQKGDHEEFTKVFDQLSTQDEVFNTVAKPIINSVFNGFNGAIFAYGQTGSGKTYSITGSPNEYQERGILPRTIEQIFEYIKKTSTQHSIYVSYLEIYNEVGYDLLNSKDQPARLEELPRVALLEDADGEAHLRNLCILPVANEQEAMRLLFLGDTNRTIAETPMNEYSSRSHCIFTIYITVTSEKSERIRRSKLHLVDLAGSERINKSKISGVTLNEAKHINLSLHYLEQVIIALSQSHRTHIPYRNSMMTYILRDSLSGNSLTAMLATLAITRRNIRETLTTCKFAQRVARICTEATINEEIDPQKEILFLREEVDELRRQLVQLKGININEKLSDRQEENCRKIVKDYVKDVLVELPVDLSAGEMRFCLKLMRENSMQHDRKQNQQTQHQLENSNSSAVLKYKKIIAEKDDEIATLRQLLNTTSQDLARNNTPSTDMPVENSISECSSLTPCEQEIYNHFRRRRGENVEQIKMSLSKKFEFAKNIVATVQKCQDNILNIRRKLKNKNNTADVNEKLRSYLLSQQNLYRDSLRQLGNLKSETDFLKESLKQAESKLLHSFKQEKGITEKGDWQSISGSLYGSCLNLNEFNGLVTSSKIDLDTKPTKIKGFPTKISNKKLIGAISSTVSKSNFLSEDLNKNFCNFYNSPKTNFDGLDDASSQEQSSLNRTNTLDGQQWCPNYSRHKAVCKQKSRKETLDELLETDSTQSHNPEKYEKIKKGIHKESSDLNDENKNFMKLRKPDDTAEFLNFMKTIPLTGDIEVDEEIFNFYRTKFSKKS
ncbi:KIF6 [Trypoxylus dichotomus]